MAKHLWVEMKITHVTLEVNEDDPSKLSVFTNDLQQQFAEEDVEHACWVCGRNPQVDNLDEECPGEKPNFLDYPPTP